MNNSPESWSQGEQPRRANARALKVFWQVFETTCADLIDEDTEGFTPQEWLAEIRQEVAEEKGLILPVGDLLLLWSRSLELEDAFELGRAWGRLTPRQKTEVERSIALPD